MGLYHPNDGVGKIIDAYEAQLEKFVADAIEEIKKRCVTYKDAEDYIRKMDFEERFGHEARVKRRMPIVEAIKKQYEKEKDELIIKSPFID